MKSISPFSFQTGKRNYLPPNFYVICRFFTQLCESDSPGGPTYFISTFGLTNAG